MTHIIFGNFLCIENDAHKRKIDFEYLYTKAREAFSEPTHAYHKKEVEFVESKDLNEFAKEYIHNINKYKSKLSCAFDLDFLNELIEIGSEQSEQSVYSDSEQSGCSEYEEIVEIDGRKYLFDLHEFDEGDFSGFIILSGNGVEMDSDVMIYDCKILEQEYTRLMKKFFDINVSDGFLCSYDYSLYIDFKPKIILIQT
jgi:hypothetical protein